MDLLCYDACADSRGGDVAGSPWREREDCGGMKAEIVSVGTEMLLGAITDTNATFLAQELSPLGIDLYYFSQVGDNLAGIVEVLGSAWGRSDLTIVTGGVGPTDDEMTREAIEAMLGETPQVDETLIEQVERTFRTR